jgi:ribosomal protein S8
MSELSANITVMQHAIDRAVERLRVPKQTAREWIVSNLRKAAFIANIIGEDGRPSRLYAFQRVAFVLADKEDAVLTVYQHHHAVTSIQRKIGALLKRELAAAERKERAVERMVRVEKARLAVEIAQCRYKMELTPSKTVVARNNAMLTQIDAKIAELDGSLLAAKRDKSAIARSLVMYV